VADQTTDFVMEFTLHVGLNPDRATKPSFQSTIAFWRLDVAATEKSHIRMGITHVNQFREI
jgi:hypothetical protein